MKLNEDNEYNAKYLAMLPQWKCHKVVRAGKISLMAADEPNGQLMIHAEPSNMPFAVPLDFLQRHAPERGGYLVVYEDGYLSYSPADVFEAGYHLLPELGKSSGGTPAQEPKEAFLEAWRKAEALAFDYSHSLPEGPERDFALQVYHRVRLVFSNGKSGMAQSAGEVAVLGQEVDGEAPIFFLPVDPDTEEAPATNMAGSTGGPLAEIDLSAADFSDALMWLKDGRCVQRAGWNAGGQWVRMWHMPHTGYTWEDDSRIYGVLPGLVLKNAQGKLVQWVPSMGDLMADDWQVYVEPLETDMPPHQLRVLQELAELDKRLTALNEFIDGGSPVFAGLDKAEQGRLREQSTYMADYLDVLTRRAAAF